MSTVAGTPGLPVAALMQERDRAARAFFPARAAQIARLCHQMAERFARGGRLLALGNSPVARSDVRHVAVEFVHPVIVGKRALPAIGLGPEGGSVASQVEAVAEPDDIAIAFGSAELATAMAAARDAGCLTVAFGAAGAEWSLEAPSADPHVRQELAETTYHVLWELVHVFFEHRGLLAGRDGVTRHDAGASSFLYPFLAEREDDLEAVVEDVRRSVLMKADEAGALRSQTLHDGAGALSAAAAELRPALAAGAHVLALGNGGSATDAMDAVADLRAAGLRALDLTEDPAILTAIANDIGVEALFARQVIAYGRAGDTVLTFSTSGNSTNVTMALAEARRRGLRTIALVGYDGGRIAAEGLADHVVVSRSQHIPRIQEAQATAWHALLGLLGGAQ
jgi:D-sedoheptulose 7-phosphate isomerase